MNTKRKFYLELFEESEAVNFYTVHFEGDEDSEFMKFIKEHQEIKFKKDLSRITYWIDKIGQTGADDLHLNSCVKLLADLHRFLKLRINQGIITIKDRTFSGNISFYTKD